ncbi:MAG: 1-acyl-sn-glycerol-3-phosphate acyltransferase [Spirochaetae bacterium HGW-Spirochaetae-7]|jgi:1-acyl-sn-glycerol-3-phosphate acyltransferase|nr:MAG: 1-acyl-sn-glycerol-3-phosphate acyltransferase [Spirochaetae bacterium HGW-Spirochaetae-7]
MLKTIAVLSYIWISAAASSPLAVLFLLLELIGLGRASRPALGAFTRVWARSILLAIGVKATVTGLGNVPDDERLCFIANHSGDLDIVMMLAYMPRPVGFVAKSEAAWFPFLNIWTLALGSSFIVRNNPRQGKKAIDRSVRSIERGHAMVIYPEGTRSRGPGILPFHRGAFKLATRPGATIIPVTIDGAYKVWEVHGRIEAADVRITVHPPVKTAGLGPEARRALTETVQATIASGLSGT